MFEENRPKSLDSCQSTMTGEWLPLVEVKDSGYYVLVSHTQLDNLVGRLMQMCELTGDTEQRTALKNEIKNRSRKWLDDLYEDAGYQKWSAGDSLREGYKAIKI